MHFHNTKCIQFTIITYSPVAYLAAVKMFRYFFSASIFMHFMAAHLNCDYHDTCVWHRCCCDSSELMMPLAAFQVVLFSSIFFLQASHFSSFGAVTSTLFVRHNAKRKCFMQCQKMFEALSAWSPSSGCNGGGAAQFGKCQMHACSMKVDHKLYLAETREEKLCAKWVQRSFELRLVLHFHRTMIRSRMKIQCLQLR